jgi:hypothetical protein
MILLLSHDIEGIIFSLFLVAEQSNMADNAIHLHSITSERSLPDHTDSN